MRMQIKDFGIYQGATDIPPFEKDTFPTIDDVEEWQYDTLIVAPVKLTNKGADLEWETGEVSDFDLLRGLDPSRDILAYISLGKAQIFLDFIEIHNDVPAGWRGGIVKDSKGNIVEGLLYANYWDKSWETIIKAQIDHLIERGATGFFFDETDASDLLSPGNNQRAGALAMLELIANLSE